MLAPWGFVRAGLSAFQGLVEGRLIVSKDLPTEGVIPGRAESASPDAITYSLSDAVSWIPGSSLRSAPE